MSFFDQDPGRPRLIFKDVDPFSGSLEDVKTKENDYTADNTSTEDSALQISSPQDSDKFDIDTEKALAYKDKHVNEKMTSPQAPSADPDSVQGIATDWSRQSEIGAIQSIKSSPPKRVSFAEVKSIHKYSPTRKSGKGLDPASEPVEESIVMDVVHQSASGNQIDVAEMKQSPTSFENSKVDNRKPDSNECFEALLSSTSSTLHQMEANLEAEKTSTTEDEIEEDNEDTSDDIISSVKDKQTCVTEEVEGLILEVGLDHKEQVLNTSQYLVSDPLIEMKRVMELQLRQREFISMMTSLMGELDSILQAEEGRVSTDDQG